MTYREHRTAAEELNTHEIENLLQGLGRDERFCAVVGWLESNREVFARAGSRQDIAGDYGKLAHAQGSVHAVNVLAAQLTNLLMPAVEGGIPKPEGV